MKKYIVQAALGFLISLISTAVLPLCAQTTDTLKNSSQVSQLRAELLQIQERCASIKAKADSLEAVVKNTRHDQEYWSAMLQPDKNCCGEQSAELRADMVQDKLIKKESALRSYHLDLEVFRVNGQKQSPEITKRYQEKYLTRKPNGDRTASMTYTVGGFLGIRR
jgi:hypothetical protein